MSGRCRELRLSPRSIRVTNDEPVVSDTLNPNTKEAPEITFVYLNHVDRTGRFLLGPLLLLETHGCSAVSLSCSNRTAVKMR